MERESFCSGSSGSPVPGTELCPRGGRLNTSGPQLPGLQNQHTNPSPDAASCRAGSDVLLSLMSSSQHSNSMILQ